MFYLIVVCLLTGIGLVAVGYFQNYSSKLHPLIRKGLKFAAGLVVVSTLALVVFVVFCEMTSFDGRDMCSDTITDQISSPIGQYQAIIFTRDCGAVTKFSDIAPIIMLRDTAQPLQFKNGRILPRYNWYGSEVNDVIFSGDYDSIKWLSKDHLLVCLSKENPYPGTTLWEGVKITYNKPAVKTGPKH